MSASVSPAGVLYVVATPLGNPDDLSPRAVRVLGEVDVIFAEDTRTGRRLLQSLGLDRPLRSCFDANEAERAAEAVALLREGRPVALVSEAGTPAVSDPGFRLVRAAIDAGARVVPIPGPSAVLAALVASGLPTDRFLFLGFPPRKAGARRALLAEVEALAATLVLYESPHRAAETLADLAAALGPDRPACLARELTKTHEELVRAPLGELARRYAAERPLGEVTLVVGGAPPAPGAPEDGAGKGEGEGEARAAASAPDLRLRARRLLEAGYSVRDVADILAAETATPRKPLYDLALSLKGA